MLIRVGHNWCSFPDWIIRLDDNENTPRENSLATLKLYRNTAGFLTNRHCRDIKLSRTRHGLRLRETLCGVQHNAHAVDDAYELIR